MRSLPIASIVVAAVIAAGGVSTFSRAQESGEQPVFRAATDVVVVPAIVTDGTGRFVHNLTRDDFVLREDGNVRPIAQFTSEPVPLAMGILLDTSGSMAGMRFAIARLALGQLVSGLEPKDEVFLQVFNDRTTLLLPWTTNKAAFGAAIDKAQPRGGTHLFRAVSDSYLLLQSNQSNRKALVLLSDGNDNDGLTQIASGFSSVPHYRAGTSTRDNPTTLRLLQVAVQRAERSNTVVYAIGIAATDSGEAPLDTSKLHELTDLTGGYTEVVKSAEDIPGAVGRINEDLRSQYLVGFQSAASRDGKRHKIELTSRDKRYRVRARSVYVAER